MFVQRDESNNPTLSPIEKYVHENRCRFLFNLFFPLIFFPSVSLSVLSQYHRTSPCLTATRYPVALYSVSTQDVYPGHRLVNTT